MCFWMMIFKGFHPYFVFFTITTESTAKNWPFQKKNSWKNMDPNRFYDEIFEFFSKKKSKFFSKFFFWKLFIRRQNVGKKKIFFEKNHDPDFGLNFDFYFCNGIVFFQKKSKFFSFFSLFMPQRTSLDHCESDPATSPHYERA